MNRIISSKQVINYFKRNVNLDNCVSVFLAGSTPNKLVPESDLDIFIVIEEKYKNKFLDNLVKIMNKFIKQNENVTYSLLRGPIKYKTKGLIHFNIYTQEEHDKIGHREQFKHELNHFLVILLKSAKVITGKPVEKMININNLKDKQILRNEIELIRKKYKLLKENNYINNREWKKTKRGWRFLNVRRYPNKYARKYLLEYFAKKLK